MKIIQFLIKKNAYFNKKYKHFNIFFFKINEQIFIDVKHDIYRESTMDSFVLMKRLDMFIFFDERCQAIQKNCTFTARIELDYWYN